VWGSPPTYATRLCTSLCSNGHPAIQLKYMYSTLLLALLFGCVCLRHKCVESRIRTLDPHAYSISTLQKYLLVYCTVLADIKK